MKPKRGLRPGTPRDDPMAAISWPEVADRFNGLNGTHLTPERIRQIGNTALAKLTAAAAEIIGTFEDNYHGNERRDLE